MLLATGHGSLPRYDAMVYTPADAGCLYGSAMGFPKTWNTGPFANDAHPIDAPDRAKCLSRRTSLDASKNLPKRLEAVQSK